MKEYLVPATLFGIGAWALLRPSPPVPSAEINLAVPVSRSRSWAPPRTSIPYSLPAPVSPAPPSVAAPISPAASRSSPFDTSYAFFHDRLVDLNSCLVTRTCPYSTKDPKAYEADVYSEMVRTLKTLKAWQKRNGYQDDRIPDLMRDFLPIENPYVKIEALKIIATQAPAPENLGVILEDVIHFSQPEVIPYGMRELARYTDPLQRQEIDDNLENVLLNGGIYSAIEVAKGIKPLITRGNYARYRGILNRLDKIPLTDDISEALRDNL